MLGIDHSSELAAFARLVARETVRELQRQTLHQTHFNTDQAAQYLGIAAKTLINWRGKPGRGPEFIRIGRRVVYRTADLDSFLAASKGGEK